MKKFAKIWLIICLVIFLLAVGCFVGALAMGTTWTDVKEAIDTGYYKIEDSIFWDFSDEWKEEWKEGRDLDDQVTDYFDVKNLDIELYGVLKVVTQENTDKLTLEVSSEDKEYVRVKEENGLKIITKPRKNSGTHLTLKVPENYSFDSLEIDAKAGSVDIDTLTAVNADIEADAGKIKADTITADVAVISVDAGKIEVSKIRSDNIKLDCDVGKITAGVDGSLDEYNMDISCDIGKIQIGDDSWSNSSKKIKRQVTTDVNKTLQATCDVGKIELTD